MASVSIWLLIIAFIVLFVILYKKHKKTQVACYNCGQTIIGIAKFCTKCGFDLQEENKKKKIGKAIVSYVFGCFGVIFSLLIRLDSSLEFDATRGNVNNDLVMMMIPSGLFLLLLFIIPSLLLGINSWRKRKQLFAAAGISLSVLSVIVFLVSLMINLVKITIGVG